MYPDRPPRMPAPHPRAGLGGMVFYGVLGLVAMVAGALAFAVFALPADFVRDHAIAAVKERTGRDLVIRGASSFTLYPSLGVSLSDVSLSAGPGFEGANPFVTMKALDLSVSVWPLLKREVQVSTLVMREPVFNLEVDANGRRSWDFAAGPSRADRTRYAQADAPVTDAAPAAKRPARNRLSGVRLEDVRIENGTLNYSDPRAGKASQFNDIDLAVTLASLDQTLDAQGSFGWKGKTVRVSSALTSLADILETRPAKVKVSFGADVVDATFEGTARLADALSTEGILQAKSASARDLAQWFGAELSPSHGFGALSAKGLLRSEPDRLSLSTADIVLDSTTARGDVSLDTGGARPRVTASLKLTALDLNTYAATGEKPAKRQAPAAAKDGSGGKARSIDDLLGEGAPAGPRVKGYTKRHGWSEEPYDLAMLGLADVDARLSIEKLTVRDIHLDQSDVTVGVKNRVMTTTLNQVRLYQGVGRGTITLDGSAETTAGLGVNLTLEGIEAKTLLADAADIDRISGKGRVAMALAGRGANERQVVGTLNGKFEASFADGAIIGVNLPEMMRNLSKGNLRGLDTAPTDKTDFSEMTSTWTVKSGVAENQDLKLVSPLLRVTGAGRVELPARQVDYMLRPKVVASLAGQGDTQDLSGIEVPVRIHGSLDDPKFAPDLAGALNNPKTVETIKELGKQFKGKKADEIVNDLLGGGESGGGGKSKGKKLLEQFLNPQ